MARIVNLGALLPEDITFVLPDGAEFTAPGDPPLHLILKIAHLWEQTGAEEGAALELVQELDDEVLGLLRMRQPELQKSPFGVFGVQHFVSELLAQYNMLAGDEEEEESPTKAEKPKTKPSTRSNGSRSSSKSSASRPITTKK